MASNQPETAQKLSRALNEMDETDLDNRMQRTADWLRRGINPNSNGTETEIAQGLQKLSQQLREAQKSVGREQPGQRPGSDSSNQNAALDQVRRLRQQLQAMSGPTGNGRSQAQARAGKNEQNSDGRNPSEQNQGTDGIQGGGQRRGQQHSGQQLSRNGSGQQPSGSSIDGSNSGDIRRGGGGYAAGTAWNNINTGNNTYGSRGIMPQHPTDATANPRDTEQSFQQQLSELGRLNQMVQGDPNLSKEVRDLTRRMQDLDPKRFPGNPAIVEQMHQEMLSSINRLEIELLNHGATGEARSGKPQSIPDGYQEAVADYYRRLSKPR